MNMEIWGVVIGVGVLGIGFVVWLEVSLRRMLRQAKKEEEE